MPSQQLYQWIQFLEIFVLLLVEYCTSLKLMECNYCFSANLKRDCYITSVQCLVGQVCYLDKVVVTYRVPNTTRTVISYEMGCNYGYLCKDGVRYGPGPFGYKRIYRNCCCSDKCVKSDGVGKGAISQCEHAQFNETTLFGSGGDTKRSSSTLFLTLVTSLMVGGGTL